MDKTKEILSTLKTIRKDFEMLKSGEWDLNYSDGTEIEESLDNVDKVINLVKQLKTSKITKNQYVWTEGWTTNTTA
tara:strand:+ start:876 stop:1103 length:228 start_codon:yes stop_codon:yes gene_type:complete